MSSTSKKHRCFVSEPIGEKPVTALPGIGDAIGKRLAQNGFDKASAVLGMFLNQKRNREFFMKWLKDTANANKKQAGDCFECLTEWCSTFLDMPESEARNKRKMSQQKRKSSRRSLESCRTFQPMTEEEFLSKCVSCKKDVSIAGDNSEPYLLKCLHSICKACLHAAVVDAISCFECKVSTPFGDVVQNHFLIQTEKKHIRHPCSCTDRAEVTRWCMDCNKFLCDDCVQAHSRLDIEHNIKKKSDAPVDSQVLSSEKEMHCSIHPQEELVLYCSTCNQLTCRDCQLKSHKLHDYQYLQEFEEAFKAPIRKELKTMSQKKKRLEKLQSEVETKIEELHNSRTIAVAEVDSVVECVKNAITARGEQLKEQLSLLCDQKEIDLFAESQKLKNFIKLLENSICFLNKALDKGCESSLRATKMAIMSNLQLINGTNSDQAFPTLNAPARVSLNQHDLPKLLESVSEFAGVEASIAPCVTATDTCNGADALLAEPVEPMELSLECQICQEHSNGKLMHCTKCRRQFHDQCHIPPVQEDAIPIIEWQCSSCIDDIGIAVGTKRHLLDLGETHMLKILMELFCKKESHFLCNIEAGVGEKSLSKLKEKVLAHECSSFKEFDDYLTDVFCLISLEGTTNQKKDVNALADFYNLMLLQWNVTDEDLEKTAGSKKRIRHSRQ